MNSEILETRLREIVAEPVPLPAKGNTPDRHRLLAKIAHEDLSLAKLAEAHWDAVAILAEAGRSAMPGALYAVWASERAGKALRFDPDGAGYRVTGTKPFCSGGGLVDHALVTVGLPEQRLIDVDLRSGADHVETDLTVWKSQAFRHTQTGSVTFINFPIDEESFVCGPGWYLDRPGFWHGACGPAACWAGGVAALVEFALDSKRDDPHTLAHLAAMECNVWAMYALLDQSGREIDAAPLDGKAAHRRALRLRHLVEHLATDVLHRFARAYGPQPLAMNEEISRRYQEADLFMRQSHGERDLECLAALLR